MSDRRPTDPDDEPNDDRDGGRGRDDDRPSDRRDRFSSGSREGSDRASGASGWLSSLLDALAALEERSETQRRRGEGPRLDYDISIRSGLGSIGDAADREGDERSTRRPSARRPRSRRTRPSPTKDYHVTTRTHDDEVIVTADVSGVDPDDVTVGVDDSTVVVAVSGREIERVDVPWEASTAAATVRNGVLTVDIHPETNE